MLVAFAGFTAAAGPLWPSVCAPGDASAKFPFCDQKLDYGARAADLVSRLTLAEKQSILDNGVCMRRMHRAPPACPGVAPF